MRGTGHWQSVDMSARRSVNGHAVVRYCPRINYES